jgi:hypothetical protein
MKKLIISFAALLCWNFLPAQSTFEKFYSPSSDQYGLALFETADSGFILQATIEKGWRNCYLLRTDRQGDTLWSKTYGTDSIQFYSMDMAQTHEGGYVMCGDYQSVFTYPSMDSYVQKVDSNGNQVWFNLFGWIAAQGGTKDYGNFIRVLSDSSVIVEGMTKAVYYSPNNYQALGTGFHSYLAKIDNGTGLLVDIKTVCVELDTSCTSVRYTAMDMEVVNNTIFWLGSPYYFSSSAGGDTILAAFNSNLDTIFTNKTIGGAYTGLSKTPDDHLLLFGKGVLAKIDTQGSFVWSTPNSSPAVPYDVKELSTGGFISIGGTTPIYPGQYPGSPTVYLNRHSANGSLLWSRTFTLPQANQLHFGYRILETSDHGFAFVGQSIKDIWLVKTDSVGHVTSMNDINSKGKDAVVYPNPSSGEFTIQLPPSATKAAVYDLVGNCIYSAEVNGSEWRINIKDKAKGVYLCKIFTGNGSVITKKVVVK